MMRSALKTVQLNQQCVEKQGSSLDISKPSQSERCVRFNIDTHGHARAPEMCLCDAIVQRVKENTTLPLVACDTCDSWHTLRCLAMESAEPLPNHHPKCLPCRKVGLLRDLSTRIVNSKMPKSNQLSGVCKKLRVPLPQHPSQSDMVVRLCYFLIVAPRLRATLCAGECSIRDLGRLAAGPGGLQSGRPAQEELVGSMTMEELRFAGKMLKFKTAGTKEQLAIRLLCCLRDEASEPYEREAAKDRPQTMEMSAEKTFKREEKMLESIVKKLNKFTVVELRRECESSGLNKQGRKAQLVERLSEHLLKNLASTGATPKSHPEGCSCDICDLELATLIQEFDTEMVM